jgi:hypothetical protein
MNDHDVELDGATEHGSRQMSALLSAAMAAAQSAAQLSADRARQRAITAERETRDAYRTAEQVARQERAAESLRHRQWNLQPTAQWLQDNPLAAAAAWASADSHRAADPVAARHAEQWETIFATDGVSMAEVRSNASAAVAEPEPVPAATAAEAGPADLTAAERAATAVLAGAADVLHEAQHREQIADISPDPPSIPTTDSTTPAADPARPVGWTAYADGSRAAAVGGRGVSTPPEQVLSRARGAAAATAAQPAPVRQVQLAPTQGLDR